MSDKDSTPTPHVAALEAEVVVARGHLAATVDALGVAVYPQRQVERLQQRARRLWFDATDTAALPEDRDRARKVLAVTGAVVVLVVVGVVRRATRH